MSRIRIEGNALKRASRAVSAAGTVATLLMLMVAIATGAAAADGPATRLTEDDEACLACHDSQDMEKELANGKTLSLYIRGDVFGGSIHAWVGCAGCHGDVDLDSHPAGKDIVSRHAFSAEASQVCSDCHSEDSLQEGPPQHARVAAAGGTACTECHNPHAVKPISDWKNEVATTDYCLTCHGKAVSVRLDDGKPFVLSVDEAALRKSVHPDLECTDCHTGFSTETHATMTFASTREHAVARAKACRNCHEDKFDQYQGSIHASLIKDGDLRAPVCTDCHGSHSVRPKAVYETVSGVPCKKCHADVFEAYVGSMHGRVRSVLGHFEAPICADCHRAHEVDAAGTGKRLREACLGCHAGALDAHRVWLPNAALHLNVVSCPACHAPLAQRRIELTLFDSTAQVPVSDSGNGGKFEALIRAADTDGNGLDAVELWTLVRELNHGDGKDKTAVLTLQGRMGVSTGADAHRLSGKTSAVRDCDSCHSGESDAFRNVTVSIVGRDGLTVRYDADKGVLNSMMSVNSVSGFYAIGGTRIKLLDALLGLAFVGGISVPIGHLSLQWLFRKYRKRNQGAGEAGKS